MIFEELRSAIRTVPTTARLFFAHQWLLPRPRRPHVSVSQTRVITCVACSHAISWISRARLLRRLEEALLCNEGAMPSPCGSAGLSWVQGSATRSGLAATAESRYSAVARVGVQTAAAPTGEVLLVPESLLFSRTLDPSAKNEAEAAQFCSQSHSHGPCTRASKREESLRTCRYRP